jgi:probable HAF family extracellular repeat protein
LAAAVGLAAACVGDYRLVEGGTEKQRPDDDAGVRDAMAPDAQGTAGTSATAAVADSGVGSGGAAGAGTELMGGTGGDGAGGSSLGDIDGGAEAGVPDATVQPPPIVCASLRRLGPLSFASGISADGQFVVGSVGSLPYRWSLADPSADINLGRLPGSLDVGNGEGTAVSRDGRFVVGTSNYLPVPGSALPRAFRWSSGLGMNDMGDLPGVTEVAFPSTALGIDANGDVVVGWMSDAQQQRRPFRWSAEQRSPRDLGELPGYVSYASEARATSADGTVVAGMIDDVEGRLHAVRWSTENSRMEELLQPPGAAPVLLNTAANAVSGDGRVIVGEANDESAQYAVRWTHETGLVVMRSLTALAMSRAVATNADGSVVVGQQDFGGESGTGAALWRFGSEQTVDALADLLPIDDLGGWELIGATGVSADGSVVIGYGKYLTADESWVAVLGEICDE